MNTPTALRDKEKARDWARRVLADPTTVLLDTETSGLKEDGAEIVQIGLLSVSGAVLMNTLVKPQHPEKLLVKGSKGISPFDVHGIHPDRLIGAPCLSDLHATLRRHLEGARLVIYHVNFDWPILCDQLAQYKLPKPPIARLQCAMLQYSAWVGEPGKYSGYKWQKLPAAPGVTAHDALADCVSTLAVIKEMAES